MRRGLMRIGTDSIRLLLQIATEERQCGDWVSERGGLVFVRR